METVPTDHGDIKAVVIALEELNCCKRCILRYIYSYNAIEINYLKPENALRKILGDEEECETPSKKFKQDGMCRVCLGILDDSTIERFLKDIPDTFNCYQHEHFSFNVGIPKSVTVRTRSVSIYLQERFPHIKFERFPVNEHGSNGIKRVFKIISEAIIAQKIKKVYYNDSPFIIDIRINYDQDDQELKRICTEKRISTASRVIINNIVSRDSNELFKKMYPVPPEVLKCERVEAEISFRAEPLFLGGRYLKFVRNMGQTPWIINDKAMTEDCVQDVIFDSINKVLGAKYNMTFSASGREDSDVRMLGAGRPFYIQIDDPKFHFISDEKFKEIEDDIAKSEMVGVIRLKIVKINDLKKIKDGEQEKEKNYKAVCHTIAPNLKNVIEIINGYGMGPLKIQQRTPMRVLHRRTLVDREKLIKSMQASTVPGHHNLIEVNLVTQAGTYVKEFVNGDFHRTRPSLASLIEYPIDVVALDVTCINLNWP